MRRFALLAVCVGVVARAAAPLSPGEDVRTVTVNGAELAYVVDGSGPPLVIVHGAFGDLRSFAGAAPILAERRSVVRVSLRHHWPNPPAGSEDEALRAYRVETHAADVAALIERLGRGPADVVGHSYGGIVAALVAASRPDLVRRLALVEPALYGILRETAWRRYIDDERGWADGTLAKTRVGQEPLEVAHALYGARFDALPELRRRIVLDNARTVRPVLVHSWANVAYTCADAGRLRMPVLLIEGEKTDPDMRQIDLELMRCLPDARRVVLPGATHAIPFDAPEAMAREVARFVTVPWPGPG